MAYIIETANPFQPFENLRKHQHPGGITIRGWLQMTYPGFQEFASPTVCLLNGRPVLRRDWDQEIQKDDIINFVAVTGSIAAIIIVVLVIILAVVLALMMGVPATPGALPASDPVFSAKGQQNEIRLGEPIEVNYGRNRIYPSFASRPFFRYQNNDQFQYALFCIGQGQYEIHAVQIGDAAITDYQEVQWEILPPGAHTTLFITNVYTSVEVGGQTLLPPDQQTSGIPLVGRLRDTGVASVFPSVPHGLTSGQHVMITGFFDTSFNTNDVAVFNVADPGRFSYVNPGPYAGFSSTDRNGLARLLVGGAPAPDEWTGPFPASPSGTQTYRIEIDVVFPKGIYHQNTKGRLEQVAVTFEVQMRLIDNVGAPLGAYEDLFFPTVTKATTTPQRITYGADVILGRYEVRARRTSIANTDITTQSEIVWEGMRGFVSGDEPDYGDLTLLAVKIRATSNLNANTQRKFNVIATRKLPIRGSGGFSAPVSTRSIIWAFVDIFRNSKYGGRLMDENFYDWDALEALDDLYEGRNEHFDWTFRDPITVWEAAKTVARVGRAVPMLVGSLITMKRDGPLEVPVSLFSAENMLKGSFEWSVKLWEPEEHDSVSIEYTEPSTGYTQEQVLATLPGGTTDNPENVRLPGVQNRAHAYREGLYILASNRYLRENITFDTGMEGFLPSFGDLIAISHDIPQWGQSGYVVAVDRVPPTYILTLSEILITEPYDYLIMLRGKQGEVLGPFAVTLIAENPKQVAITLVDPIDFLLSGTTEPMIFLFGKTDQITKYGRVVKLEPQGGERVKITAVNDAPIIHTFDGLSTPPLIFPSLPPVVPDLPVVTDLFLTRISIPSIAIQASWPAAFGAQSYIVQTSTDGTSWENQGTTVRPIMVISPVYPGTVYVRVAGINSGQGPWRQGVDYAWILEDGFWNDVGIWIDMDHWNDS